MVHVFLSSLYDYDWVVQSIPILNLGVWNLVAAGGTKYDRNLYNQAELTSIDNKEIVLKRRGFIPLLLWESTQVIANQKL